MRILLFTAALLAVDPALASADDFYVDGAKGADVLANGRSPQTPWKTISYALANIPSPIAPGTHTLHVIGGQTYALATNGEAFPLQMRAGISLVGSGAPVLAPLQSQDSAVRFPIATSFQPDTQVRDVVFRGDVILGGAMEHSPTLRGCRFEAATLRLGSGANGRSYARVEECTFDGERFGYAGVFVLVGSQGPKDVRPTFVGCEFSDLLNGIRVEHGIHAPMGSRMHVRVERCRFTNCLRGVSYLIWAMDASNRSELSIIDSSFVDSGYEAIGVSGRFDGLTVEGCRVVNGSIRGNGIVFDSSDTTPATLRRNVIARAGTGIALTSEQDGTGTLPRVRIEDCLITDCLVGVQIGQSRQPVAIEIERCRLRGNVRGVRVPSSASWSASSATIALRSTVIADQYEGVWLDTPQVVELDGVTIADHTGTGVLVVNAGAGSRLTHCVLAGNAVELSGTIAASYCAFQNQDVPGIGNLRVDPLLQRPTYKLHEASPCIDAGDAALALPATDYEGDPRLVAGRFGMRPDLGADEFVPAGSVHVHGLPGVGQAGLPPRMASPNRTARIGEPLDVQVRDARDATGAAAMAAALACGVDEVVVDLAPFAAPGSLLLTTPLWVTPAVAPGPLGIGTVRFAIPSDPSLYGGVAQLQWLVLYGSTSAVPLATSDALRVTIGR